MTHSTEKKITHDEIQFISFECKHCGAETRADLRHDLQHAYLSETRPEAALSCGVCSAAMSPAADRALSSFVRALKELGGAEEKIALCFPVLDRPQADDTPGDRSE